MALGLEFIDPDLRENHVVCCGMREITSGKDSAGAAMLDTAFVEVSGRPYLECANQAMADVAAQGVAHRVGHEGDKCGMHQTDKIPRSMCGDLTRSKKGVVVNPFPEGVRLMGLFHKAAVCFSYSDRIPRICSCGDRRAVGQQFPQARELGGQPGPHKGQLAAE